MVRLKTNDLRSIFHEGDSLVLLWCRLEAEASGKLLVGDIVSKIGPLSVEGSFIVGVIGCGQVHLSFTTERQITGRGKESVEAHMGMCGRPVTVEFHIPSKRRDGSGNDLWTTMPLK